MDVVRTSAETQERRKRELEDIQKRNTYRIAHGLKEANSQGMGAWTYKDSVDTGERSTAPDGIAGMASDESKASHRSRNKVYVDWEGNKRPVKKWLGIW